MLDFLSWYMPQPLQCLMMKHCYFVIVAVKTSLDNKTIKGYKTLLQDSHVRFNKTFVVVFLFTLSNCLVKIAGGLWYVRTPIETYYFPVMLLFHDVFVFKSGLRNDQLHRSPHEMKKKEMCVSVPSRLPSAAGAEGPAHSLSLRASFSFACSLHP